jgi:mannose-6-phosphate isomerase
MNFSGLTDMNSAIFFDRDDTLTDDDGYTFRPADLNWCGGAVDAIARSKSEGHLVVVISNQSGVARGLFCDSDVVAFHDAMQASLATKFLPDGGYNQIDGFYYCPFHTDGAVAEYRVTNHPDRKPLPGMLRRALIDLKIDPAAAAMIGDSDRDADAGHAAGVIGVKLQKPRHLDIEPVLAKLAAPRTGAQVADEMSQRAGEAKEWVFNQLLPFWASKGFDQRSNCFHEQFSSCGAPIAMQRRIMVQARQVFTFARAGRIGWAGPWRGAVNSGLQVLMAHAMRPDGGPCHALDNLGRVTDDRRDLYDLAFILLALGEASRALGGHQPALDMAETLFDWLQQNWVHPNGGYLEGDIVAPNAARSQNPHMHMLEALLTLYEVTSTPKYLTAATEIVSLISAGAAHQNCGVVAEFYTDDFTPILEGDKAIIEPGHQFEWSFLLDWYGRVSGRDHDALAQQILTFGEVYGVNAHSGLIHETVDRHGRIGTDTSRLWTHCERLKANLARATRHGDPAAGLAVCQSYDALRGFYRQPMGVLAHERKMATGSVIEDTARASSLYHVVFAMADLIEACSP